MDLLLVLLSGICAVLFIALPAEEKPDWVRPLMGVMTVMILAVLIVTSKMEIVRAIKAQSSTISSPQEPPPTTP